jgi:hypothetical protein
VHALDGGCGCVSARELPDPYQSALDGLAVFVPCLGPAFDQGGERQIAAGEILDISSGEALDLPRQFELARGDDLDFSPGFCISKQRVERELFELRP